MISTHSQNFKPSYKITNRRRLTQTFFLILYFIFPIFRIFFFDSEKSNFVLLGKTIGINNSVLMVIGLIILLLAVILMAITTGRSFCGWVCPQNFLSEIINKFRKKNNFFYNSATWAIGLLIALAVSFNFMFYFGEPREILHLLFSGQFNGTVLTFAIFFGILVFAGVGIYRHDFCKYACPYGIMQASVADKTTLRVRFEKERSQDCINCSDCTNICYVGIEPRQLIQHDPGCMNCGLCVEACHNVLEPLGVRSMLSFTAEKDKNKQNLNSKAVLIIVSNFLVFLIMFSYMFFSLPSLDLMITRNDKHVSIVKNGTISSKYFLSVTNQTAKKLGFTLSAENIPIKDVYFSENNISLDSGESKKIEFMILANKSEFKNGIQKFKIIASDLESKNLINKTESSIFVPFE